MSKRFVNAPDAVVPDLMQGLALDASRVTLLDPSSGHHVAIRSSLANKTQPRRVSVVSGGGSGHEPMAAGYVAEGMLAGAAAGGVFASPSVSAITALLDAVAAHSTGILVVVMSYEGDRLNFGIAVEEYEQRVTGCPVEIIFIADDIALPDVPDKRGIAGTIFVLKVAGAAADQGRPLVEVTAIARKAAECIVSFGVALEPCTIPGRVVDTERLGPDEIGLGMGIHGEHAAEKKTLSKMDKSSFTNDLVNDICTRLDEALKSKIKVAESCQSLAIMVNNLGAVSQAEMLIFCNAVAIYLSSGKGSVLDSNQYKVQMYAGSFMTSLQMTGVSISCFVLASNDDLMEQCLRSPTESSSWVSGFQLQTPNERRYVTPSAPSDSTAAEGTVSSSGLSMRTENCIVQITSTLLNHYEELAALDEKTGDGDFGETIRRGCQQIQSDLKRGKYSSATGDPARLFQLLAISAGSMGASSGALTTVFLHATADSFQRNSHLTGDQSWRMAFVDGTNAVMEQGRAAVGHRTLVDALKPAADVLADPEKSISEAADAARIGYESTKAMTSAMFGRSAFLSADQLLNNPDPGARAISIILDVLQRVLSTT